MWVTSLCQLSYCRAKRVDVTVTPKIEIIALNSTEWRGLCRLCVIYRFITTLPHLFSLLAIVLWAIGSCKNIQSTTTWATTVCKRNIYIIHNEDEKGLRNVYMYTVKVVRKFNSHYNLHSWKAVIAYPTGAPKFLGFFSPFLYTFGCIVICFPETVLSLAQGYFHATFNIKVNYHWQRIVNLLNTANLSSKFWLLILIKLLQLWLPWHTLLNVRTLS